MIKDSRNIFPLAGLLKEKFPIQDKEEGLAECALNIKFLPHFADFPCMFLKRSNSKSPNYDCPVFTLYATVIAMTIVESNLTFVQKDNSYCKSLLHF
jgi:hypothetical protein